MAGLSGLSVKMIAAFASTAAAVGGGGYLIKNDQGEPIIQSLFSSGPNGKPAPVEIEPVIAEEPKEEVASLPEATSKAPAVEIKKPELPSFDIMRVEKDGSVVIAGKAPANSEVEIVEDGKVLGKTRSSADGDFVIVFDTPLSVGDHELTIKAMPEGKEPLLSAETGIVTIPEPSDEKGEVLALVQELGQASRILQVPNIELAKPVEEPVKVVSAPESEPVEEQAVAEIEKPQESVIEPATKSVTASVDKPVLVQAVDVEPNRVFIAGQGEANRSARVYINDEFKGTTRISPKGAFLFELSEGLTAGSYDLRVDVLDADNSEVASRAAVTIDHSPEPVVVAEVTPEPVAPEPVAPEPEAKAELKPEVKTPEIQPEVETVAVEPEPEPAVELKPVIKTGRSVIIRRGDSLWKISRRMLGEGRKYTTIFSANNNQIKDPNRIYPGQVFDVPDLEEDQAGTDQKQSG